MIIDDLPSYKPLFRSFFSGVAPQALLMENPGLQLPPLPPKAVDRRKFFRANFTKWWFQRRNMGDFTMVNQLEHCCFDILYSWYFSTFCWVGRTLFFPNVSPDLSFFAHWFSREFSPVWWVEHVFFFPVACFSHPKRWFKTMDVLSGWNISGHPYGTVLSDLWRYPLVNIQQTINGHFQYLC